MTKSKVVICPYCGETQPSGDRCRACAGLFEPLSRQATHNQMGPWFIRDPQRPFQPGASYETLVKMIERGVVTKYTVLRGPTTRQYWTVARHTPGVAHLLGYCHQCDTTVNPRDLGCSSCGAPFGAYLDRNHLGLPEVKALPWEAGEPAEDSSQTVFGSLLEPDPLRPQASGLSSFGTDDELIAAPAVAATYARLVRPAAVASPAMSSNGGAHVNPVHARVAPVAPAMEAHVAVSDAQVRSLQRRLQSQRRTTQWLIGMLLVIAALAFGATFDWFGLFEGDPSRPSAPSPTNAEEDGRSADSADPALPGTGEAPDDSASSTPASGDVPNTTTPPTDAGDAGGEAARRFEAEFTSAVELAKSSTNTDLPIDERITMLRGAIASLRTLLSAPAESRPASIDVDLEIQRWERELRRLEIEKEFPD
jgi:hypothetical protein